MAEGLCLYTTHIYPSKNKLYFLPRVQSLYCGVVVPVAALAMLCYMPTILSTVCFFAVWLCFCYLQSEGLGLWSTSFEKLQFYSSIYGAHIAEF